MPAFSLLFEGFSARSGGKIRIYLFIISFGTYSNPKVFRYSLRVTTAGSFVVPPIQASCMYDESVASLGECGKVFIRP